MESIPFAELAIDSGHELRATNYAPPPKRGRGIMVKDPAELVAILKQKGLV
jgi:electron transfer flavoprotein beta subunit